MFHIYMKIITRKNINEDDKFKNSIFGDENQGRIVYSPLYL